MLGKSLHPHVHVHSVSSGHIISCKDGKRKFHFTAGVLAHLLNHPQISVIVLVLLIKTCRGPLYR